MAAAKRQKRIKQEEDAEKLSVAELSAFLPPELHAHVPEREGVYNNASLNACYCKKTRRRGNVTSYRVVVCYGDWFCDRIIKVTHHDDGTLEHEFSRRWARHDFAHTCANFKEMYGQLYDIFGTDGLVVVMFIARVHYNTTPAGLAKLYWPEAAAAAATTKK
jgi:hypothetical protein